MRLQDYAPKIFDDYIPSHSGIKKAIKRGQFLANGVIAQTGTWINHGQVLELVEDETPQPKVYKFKLEVIFEDDHLAVIYKPSGLTVSGNSFKTVSNALPHNLKKGFLSDSLSWPTPVHRLDNQTSGLLLIAKTKTAQIELGKQFSNHTIQKIYCAIVVGETLINKIINFPIEQKDAETSFEIIKVVKSLKYQNLSCLKVYPKTGRTHQIRIHLAAIGHPVLGDKLYGENEFLHRGNGLFLCASEVKFMHPKTFETIHLKIDPPHKFKSLLIREKRRWNTYNF